MPGDTVRAPSFGPSDTREDSSSLSLAGLGDLAARPYRDSVCFGGGDVLQRKPPSTNSSILIRRWQDFDPANKSCYRFMQTPPIFFETRRSETRTQIIRVNRRSGWQEKLTVIAVASLRWTRRAPAAHQGHQAFAVRAKAISMKARAYRVSRWTVWVGLLSICSQRHQPEVSAAAVRSRATRYSTWVRSALLSTSLRVRFCVISMSTSSPSCGSLMNREHPGRSKVDPCEI